jgi:hypothetical protein
MEDRVDEKEVQRTEELGRNEEVQRTEELGRNEGVSTAALAGVGEGAASANVAAPAAGEEQPAPLFSPNDSTELRGQWDAIQAGFVDEPRKAVEQADKLVAAAMKRMAETFATERAKLEGQWDRGDDVSTEDLRLALRRYRSFFNRLLSM